MAEKTILKWAGSKVGIMEQLRPHLPKTKRLVEPFAGSCAVMMNTDYEEYLIADINFDLTNLYMCAKHEADDLILNGKAVFSFKNDEVNYKQLRYLFNERMADIPIDKLAVIFLFLNRHGFNGLCRYNQSGKFNVPYGHYKKPYFPEKEIIAFSDKANKADIKCQGWAETLLQTCAGDGVYADPPYMGTGFTRYHTAGFNDADQVALAETLAVLHDHRGIPVTASNSIAAKELYADLGFIIHEIEAPRKISSSGNRKPVTEIIATLGA
ncbi:Dam family site-specific DNA-(adenine-N6)-methyltransferase [Morganella morganii]|uniref:DNA adenine methylase n=1 Tax=Morganella morganii TaxID=582 RepID=UPI0020239170|nr:Dam family site-specific DNA-(adenine-N6)-methyltransferase [Morganella morganii]WPU19527.1 Dam family site-specific DNA-(adenine-N6)-methyltransferase [Morganella morganii]HCD1105760.1 Dam family site-specific DNA-(adenine-N6)-methyltransferase [Morganella morganii]